MRLLVTILKAHDIPEFDEAVDKVLYKFDKMIYYWYPIYQTRPLLRQTFMLSKEYTHLAILCDDLIVNEESVNKILNHAENGHGFVCGVANVDNTPQRRNMLNVSLYPTGKKRNYIYIWVEVGSEQHKWCLSQTQPIEILHMGEPFPIIRRDIAEKFSFDLDDRMNGYPDPSWGCCNDVVMSSEAYDLHIPIMCDFTAFFYHMKTSDAQPIPLVVGKREPFMKFVPAIG
jgi:hypothetical protein